MKKIEHVKTVLTFFGRCESILNNDTIYNWAVSNGPWIMGIFSSCIALSFKVT
jgi:hypothetical protein